MCARGARICSNTSMGSLSDLHIQITTSLQGKVTSACVLGQLFPFRPFGKISAFVFLWMYLGFELFLFFFSFFFFFFVLIFHLLKDLQEKEIIYAPPWKSMSLFIPLHFTGKYVIPFRSMN